MDWRNAAERRGAKNMEFPFESLIVRLIPDLAANEPFSSTLCICSNSDALLSEATA